ncbi:hypothetical protein SAMN05444851_2020 [Aliiroseovarius sediminilitoris]|uniref:Uncharacterized protein n=1 Tax=Aliiroseovarius sediminilitoris TaxID=1173584 RepID=A0A1I0PY10_9RHOB|nr:hypothetical protein [Aliiroseovarius sediminilitoris]SEW19294.1 hypothetical protein SAMN05444851_2020 [Aliiroseovarius sediminilitoris]
MNPVYILNDDQAEELADLFKATLTTGEYGFDVPGGNKTYNYMDLTRCLNAAYQAICKLVEDRDIARHAAE